jgi:hypothetical protein
LGALVLVVAALLLSCSDPRDAAIPTDPNRWEATLQPDITRLPDEDRRLIVSYLARIKADAALTGQPIAAGLTVRRAIQNERDYQRAQTTARAEARQQQDRAEQQRNEFDQQAAAIFTVALVRKDVAPADLAGGSRSERATFEFELRNLGGQPITEIEGTIDVLDGFQREKLKSVELRYTQPIAGGTTASWEDTVSLDPFLTSDLRLRNTEARQLTVSFHPKLLRFADGRRMEPPATLSTQ